MKKTVLKKDPEGGWMPSHHGYVSHGEVFEEAIDNIKEANAIYLEDERSNELKGDEQTLRNQFMVPIYVTT